MVWTRQQKNKYQREWWRKNHKPVKRNPKRVFYLKPFMNKINKQIKIEFPKRNLSKEIKKAMEEGKYIKIKILGFKNHKGGDSNDKNKTNKSSS